MELMHKYSRKYCRGMEKLEDWPNEWKEILLCTKQWEYNGECRVNYRKTFAVGEQREWKTCQHNLGVHHFGNQQLRWFHRLYLLGSDKLVCQMEEGGHWFIFFDGMMEDYCSTCDGKTETSCSIIECVSLHDLVWWGMTEWDRCLLNISCNYDSFEEFRKNVTKTQLKKKIFC